MKQIAAAVCTLALAVSAFAADAVVKRGAPISRDTKSAKLADVVANPDGYTKTPIVVEGVIATACTAKGCWMQLAPVDAKAGMRVTFKDYGFFIPLDAKGMRARAEGVAVVKTLSKEEADHLAGEGATLARNADGTAREVSFVASGVELRK
jgi:hypothetical protein